MVEQLNSENHSWKSHSWSTIDRLDEKSTCDIASWMSKSWSTTDYARVSIKADTAARDCFLRRATTHAHVPVDPRFTQQKELRTISSHSACTDNIDSGPKTKCSDLAIMHLPKHHPRGAGRQGKDSNPKSLSSLDFELAIWKRCMGGKHLMPPGLVRVRSIDSNPAISSDAVAKSRQQMIRARTEPDIRRASPDRTSKNPAISSDAVAKSRQQMIRARTEPDISASPDRTSKNSTKIQRRVSSDSIFSLSNVTDNKDNKDPDEKKEKGQQHAGFDSPFWLLLWPISAVLVVLNKTMMCFSYRFQLSSTRARTCRLSAEGVAHWQDAKSTKLRAICNCTETRSK
jgi:hypothetical protein